MNFMAKTFVIVPISRVLNCIKWRFIFYELIKMIAMFSSLAKVLDIGSNAMIRQ